MSKTEQIVDNPKTGNSSLGVVRKRFWGGFGKMETEEEHCLFANPMVNMGFNGLIESIGIPAYWWEYRVFVGGKPMFRCKSKNRKKIKVKRFLGVCWVNVA